MDTTLCDVNFYKMHGSGNDFVLIDNRTVGLSPDQMEKWAQAICKRSFGVGADGFIVLDLPGANQEGIDYIWHFFNADGSRPEMCGNGSRCAAFLAHHLGMAPAEHVLGTDAGPIKAQVLPDKGEVRVQLTPAMDMRTNISLDLGRGSKDVVHYVNTGVPHAVLVAEEVSALDVAALGRTIRFHQEFAPAGTNANFIQVLDRDTIVLRTYERGVEGETYACGTGAAASVAVAHELGLAGRSVHVTTSGGEHLRVSLEGDLIFLQGNATLVYCGTLSRIAMGL